MSLKNRDYRVFEKTLVHYLDDVSDDKAVKNIKDISDSIEQIQSLIDSKEFIINHIKEHICADELNVSNNYYKKFVMIVNNTTNKNELIRYLYNIWLCGQGLSMSRCR